MQKSHPNSRNQDPVACAGPAKLYPRNAYTGVLPDITDLSALPRRVLCVVDEDNLRISILDHRRRLSYRRLYQRLADVTDHLSAWAVLTSPRGDRRRALYLSHRHWRVLTITQETVSTARGIEKKANADFEFAFMIGHLVTAGRYDAVIVGTGDGDLGTAVGRGLKQAAPQVRMYVLAVNGATSSRLRQPGDLIDDFIPIGLDLTRPMQGHRVRNPFRLTGFW